MRSRISEKLFVMARVKSYMSEKLCVKGSEINDNTTFDKDLSMNFEDRLEFFMNVQIKFNVPDVPFELENVGELIDHLDLMINGTK